jgi:hypothetical protein
MPIGLTTDVIGGLPIGGLRTGGLGVPGITGGLPIGGLGVPGITGGFTIGGLGVPGIIGGFTTGVLGVTGGLTTEETGGLTVEVFLLPVTLSITAFVAAPKAAPVNAVPNLLVVPVDFLTAGFAEGVTDVLVVGEVVFDVSDGLALVTAGFAEPVLVRLVRGPNGLAEVLALVDVIGRDVTLPRDGCLPKFSLPKEEPSPRTTEVTGRPVDKFPRSRTPLGLRISRPRSPASKFTNGS